MSNKTDESKLPSIVIASGVVLLWLAILTLFMVLPRSIFKTYATVNPRCKCECNCDRGLNDD